MLNARDPTVGYLKIIPFDLKERSMAGRVLRQNISSGRLTLAFSLKSPVSKMLECLLFRSSGARLSAVLSRPGREWITIFKPSVVVNWPETTMSSGSNLS